MILTLLLYWSVHDQDRRYPSMAATQHVAYISDVAADRLKPLFIAGCTAAAVLLDLSFGADRWLRRRHDVRLVPNATLGERALADLTIVCALIGTAGLILLSVFDVLNHKNLHDGFLLMFIAGYVLSAVFICWEYQRLGIRESLPLPPLGFPLGDNTRQRQGRLRLGNGYRKPTALRYPHVLLDQARLRCALGRACYRLHRRYLHAPLRPRRCARVGHCLHLLRLHILLLHRSVPSRPQEAGTRDGGGSHGGPRSPGD